MTGRRKRLKSALHSTEQGSDLLGKDYPVDSRKSSAVPQSQEGFHVDRSMFECGSFACRCSVRLIHEVVSKFDSQKKELVKAIGFEGLLYFPPIKQFNRKFSLWLMSCVNEQNCSINIGQHIRMKFNKVDVRHVFGIPISAKPVLDVLVSTREARDRVIESFLGADFKVQRSVKIVQEIIECQYAAPMSKEDADRFKVAFVVFVVSNLLCPSAKYDYAYIDYWNAIQDPDDIETYDWAGYVICRLLEAVSKFKQDVSNNIKFPNISGCSIFLQVLYLDSLHIEGLSMAHKSFPRVRDFPFDTLRCMIMADKNFAGQNKTHVGPCISKLRDPSECIYTWATDETGVEKESRSHCLLAIWETAVAMVHLLNIPLEAAGPVFVAAADFQEQINSGLSVNGTHAIKFMIVIVSLMIPYSRGFQFKSSYDRNNCKTE